MANLKTRSGRSILPRRSAPYWYSPQKGIRLGYRKAKGKSPGPGIWRGEKWDGVAKVYIRWPLATADDQEPADGDKVLSFEQARDQLLALAKVGKVKVAKTVEEAMVAYLDWFAVHRKSLAATKSVVDAHIIPALGGYAVSDLRKDLITAWAERLAEAPLRRRGGKVLNADLDDPDALRARRASANRILTVLKAGLNRVHDGKHFPNPEAWREAKPFEDVNVARNRYLDHAECLRLLNACDPDFRQVVRAALSTGCRYGDLRKAKVGDYNRDDGTWLIPDPKAKGPRRPRRVQLTPDGRTFFEQLTVGRAGSDWLFTRLVTKDGNPVLKDGERIYQPWRPGQQTRRMEVACGIAKIDPPVTIHEMKHTFCSLALKAGMLMWQLSKATGTSMPTLERHYGHLADAELKAAVEAHVPSFGVEETNVKSIA